MVNFEKFTTIRFGRYPYPNPMPFEVPVSISRPYNIHLPKQYPPSTQRRSRPLLFLHTHHRQSHRMSAVSGIVYLLGRESPYLPPVSSLNEDIPPANISSSPRLAPRRRHDRVSECKSFSFFPIFLRTSLHHHHNSTRNLHRVKSVYPYRTTHSLAGSCSFPYSLHPAQSIHPNHCSSAHLQSLPSQHCSSGLQTPPSQRHHPLSPDQVPIHRATQLTL